MPSLIVALKILPDDYLRLYQGVARDVSATALDGRRVKFPAAILKPYLTHQGISGVFEIHFTEQWKFESIHQLKSPE